MFSLLDALLDKPMDVILQGLSLSEDINGALMGNKPGRLMASLYLAKSYENGAWKTAEKLAGKLGLDAAELPEMFTGAINAVKHYDFLD